MTFITEVSDVKELKRTYRRLAMIHHPDKGGSIELMQRINEEYSIWQSGLDCIPDALENVQVGNTVYINGTKSIVTFVDEKSFKAKSTITKREALFDKKTGLGVFMLSFRASTYNYWAN